MNDTAFYGLDITEDIDSDINKYIVHTLNNSNNTTFHYMLNLFFTFFAYFLND